MGARESKRREKASVALWKRERENEDRDSKSNMLSDWSFRSFLLSFHKVYRV
jgi:hypothetical protein